MTLHLMNPFLFLCTLSFCCCPTVIVVLTNKEDSTALLLEAERQGLSNGDYVFFLVQHFEVSGSRVSKAADHSLAVVKLSNPSLV